MATKKKPAVKATAAPAAPIINYTNYKGEESTFEFIVPECAKINEDDCPRECFYPDNNCLFVRIDDFAYAYHIGADMFFDKEVMYSLPDDEWGPFDDSCSRLAHLNEETDDYDLAPDKKDMYDWLVGEFKAYGCVYYCVIWDGRMYQQIGSDQKYSARFYNSNTHTVCPKGSLNFSAKYEPGKNMFYHHDSNRAIRASRIDTLTITKKSGYNPTIKYTMADGNTVSECDVCTPEMAHEWINSKS